MTGAARSRSPATPRRVASPGAAQHRHNLSGMTALAPETTGRPTGRTTDPEQVRELERQLVEYPEERGEILLELADTWRRAGEHDRACALLGEVVSGGGENAEYGRVALAESFLERGQVPEAHAELDALRASRPSSWGPCLWAAELLEEHGQLRHALRWFNIAIGRLDTAELDTLGTEFGWILPAAVVVNGRKRVREAMGLAPDQLDLAAPSPPRLPGPRPLPTGEELLASVSDEAMAGKEVRSLFWPQSQFLAARRRWPEVFVANGDDHGDYRRRLETQWRELADRGVNRVILVPATVDGLASFSVRRGTSVDDAETRRAYMEEQYEAGAGISWPPPRNSACWCGSGSNYKKCCRAALTSSGAGPTEA